MQLWAPSTALRVSHKEALAWQHLPILLPQRIAGPVASTYREVQS